MPEIRKYKVTLKSPLPKLYPSVDLWLDAYDAADARVQAEVASKQHSIFVTSGESPILPYVAKIEPVRPQPAYPPESS